MTSRAGLSNTVDATPPEELTQREAALAARRAQHVETQRQILLDLEKLRRNASPFETDSKLAHRLNDLDRQAREVIVAESELEQVAAAALAARKRFANTTDEILRDHVRNLESLRAAVADGRIELEEMKARAEIEEEAESPEPELSAADVIQLEPRVPAAPPPDPEWAERRQRERVPVSASVTLSSEDNFYTGFSTDLSDGGVFVATINTLPRDTEVELEIELPNGQSVRTTGVVRWVREWNDDTPLLHPGMGIEFVSINAPQQGLISAFLHQREALFYAE